MDFLCFSGSLRKDSLNKKLVQVAAGMLQAQAETRVSVVDLKSFSMPVYDGDIEAEGIPDGVKKLGESIRGVQALVISCPEYNGSIAGSLKNTIDWISRIRPMVLDKKPVLLLGATPGGFAAIRGLSASRVPLEILGCFVYPQTFGVAKANEAFLPTGELADPAQKQKLSVLIKDYFQFVQKLKA